MTTDSIFLNDGLEQLLKCANLAALPPTTIADHVYALHRRSLFDSLRHQRRGVIQELVDARADTSIEADARQWALYLKLLKLHKITLLLHASLPSLRTASPRGPFFFPYTSSNHSPDILKRVTRHHPYERTNSGGARLS